MNDSTIYEVLECKSGKVTVYQIPNNFISYAAKMIRGGVKVKWWERFTDFLAPAS